MFKCPSTTLLNEMKQVLIEENDDTWTIKIIRSFICIKWKAFIIVVQTWMDFISNILFSVTRSIIWVVSAPAQGCLL